MIRTTTLPNGARIVTEVVESVYSAAIDLWINVGSALENEAESGFSHCLEHMLFKGTQSRGAEQIAEEIEDVGGMLSASTSRELTKVYSHVLGENVGCALDIIFDMVRSPKLAAGDLELERKVILDELHMYEDDPTDLGQELLYARMWEGCNYANPIIGTRQSLSRVNSENLRAFFAEHYQPKNMILSIAGNFDEAAVLEQIEAEFAKFPVITSLPDKQYIAPVARKFSEGLAKEIEQNYLFVVLEALSAASPKHATMQVIDLCLAASASSRLFKELRERRGLIYNLTSFQHSYKDCGLFGIYVAANPENCTLVHELILSEFEKLKADGLSAKEINRAKKQLKTDLLLDLESMSARSSNNASDLVCYDRIISLQEVQAEVEEVDNEKVIALAQELLVPQKVSTVVVGPQIDYEFLPETRKKNASAARGKSKRV